jgi:hypothetical protein
MSFYARMFIAKENDQRKTTEMKRLAIISVLFLILGSPVFIQCQSD